jgi:hypothetical protein
MRMSLAFGAWLDHEPVWLPPREADAVLAALRDELPWEQRQIVLFGRRILQRRWQPPRKSASQQTVSQPSQGWNTGSNPVGGHHRSDAGFRDIGGSAHPGTDRTKRMGVSLDRSARLAVGWHPRPHTRRLASRRSPFLEVFSVSWVTPDRVTAWLRVFGMVTSAPGVRQQPIVINGFSDLILELYG